MTTPVRIPLRLSLALFCLVLAVLPALISGVIYESARAEAERSAPSEVVDYYITDRAVLEADIESQADLLAECRHQNYMNRRQ